MKVSRRGNARKLGSRAVSSEVVPAPVQPVRGELSTCHGVDVFSSQAKGGGERWVIMATAMTNALERMRIMYELISHLKELHEREGGPFSAAGNWTPLLNETAAVANILKTGLKAR